MGPPEVDRIHAIVERKQTIQGGNLIVTPARPGKLDSKALGEALDYVVKKRKRVLKRLLARWGSVGVGPQQVSDINNIIINFDH